jgi:hypothetical protein
MFVCVCICMYIMPACVGMYDDSFILESKYGRRRSLLNPSLIRSDLAWPSVVELLQEWVGLLVQTVFLL